ncbi:hypothetical protein Trydic_g3869 [Trypoxylus dichotomus]
MCLTPACAKGDNYLGVIAQISIEGVRNDEPITLHWIAKSVPQNETFRKFAVLDKVYRNEIYIYEEVFPIFRKFCAENGIPKTPITLAKLIGSHTVPFQEALIMEDMKEKGFILKNRKDPLDFQHVKLAMENYGRYHAISYAIKDQKPEIFNEIKKAIADDFFLMISEEVIKKQEETYCSRTLNTFDPIKEASYIKIFEKYKMKSFEIVREKLRKGFEDPYAMVNHGDSWMNNMLFKYEDETAPTSPIDVCLLDFQLARCGSPAFDLSYFIFSSTEKELRDRHYDELIDVYYQSLCKQLVALGSSPGKMLPFDVLQEHLKRYSVVGYFLTQLVLHIMLSDAEETPDFQSSLNDDNISEALDYKSKNEEFYSRRIKDIVVDFVEKGYFDFLDNEYNCS